MIKRISWTFFLEQKFRGPFLQKKTAAAMVPAERNTTAGAANMGPAIRAAHWPRPLFSSQNF
jgi:hypothetical protein